MGNTMFLSKQPKKIKLVTLTYPVASIFKDMHFNSTSTVNSQLLSSVNSLEIFESPPVQTSLCFQKINMHTSGQVFHKFPTSLDKKLKI
jgi:hypothetical protein